MDKAVQKIKILVWTIISDYSLEEVSSGAGKGAAVGAGAGAMFGLIGMAVGAAAGALINNSTTTNCRCNNCGYQWEKIM